MAEFMPPVGDAIGTISGLAWAGAEGEFTTGVKGQFGQAKSGGTGKKLKIYIFYRCFPAKTSTNLQTTAMKLKNKCGALV